MHVLNDMYDNVYESRKMVKDFWISWDGVYWVKYDKMAALEKLIFS